MSFNSEVSLVDFDLELFWWFGCLEQKIDWVFEHVLTNWADIIFEILELDQYQSYFRLIWMASLN